MRKFCVLAAMMAMLGTSTAWGDVFFSGQFDVNGGVSRADDGDPGTFRANASGLNLAGGGISYNNVWGSVPVTGASQAGDTIIAVGMVPIASARINTSGVGSLGTDSNLVAIYALRGTVTATPSDPGGAAANFQIEQGGGVQGSIWIMDRSTMQLLGADGAPGGAGINADNQMLVTDNPLTWANALANLNNGVVAKLSINALPTEAPFYDPGYQGTNAVEDPPVIFFNNINTAQTEFNASALSNPEFKLQIDDFGSLFLNPDVAPPGGFGPFTQLDFAAYLLLNQQVPTTPFAFDVSLLNQIANQLIGQDFANNSTAGSTFNPAAGLLTGDIIQDNTGGRVIFGGQFDQLQQEVPEPASMIVWSVLAAGGAGIGMIRRRRAQKNA